MLLGVFPTYVGVILTTNKELSRLTSIPHVCGGDPMAYPVLKSSIRVFPTYVGVILQSEQCTGLPSGIPHVCGGKGPVGLKTAD